MALLPARLLVRVPLEEFNLHFHQHGRMWLERGVAFKLLENETQTAMFEYWFVDLLADKELQIRQPLFVISQWPSYAGGAGEGGTNNAYSQLVLQSESNLTRPNLRL